MNDNNMTDIKELNKRINTCKWRRKVNNNAHICALIPYPCRRIVEKGDCEVVAEYFKEKNNGENKN